MKRSSYPLRVKREGFTNARVLNAVAVETILHGAPDCDAARIRPESPGAAEARRLLEIANEAYAKANPTTKREDSTDMNKRERIFATLCEEAGLKIVDWRALGGGQRVGGLVQAGNGATQRFSMAASAGQDNPRGDPNLRAELRRFARTNEATALSVAIASAVQPVKASQPPHKPRAILRVLTPPKQPAPAPAPAPAPVAIKPAPAPAPVPTPTPAPTVTPIHQQPGPQLTMTTKPAAIRLSRPEFHKLTKFVEAADLNTFPKIQALADAAAKELGFAVTHGHAREALEVLEIDHFKRKTADAGSAMELAQANAAALLELMAAMGEKPSAAYSAVLARHGVDLPKLAQKAA